MRFRSLNRLLLSPWIQRIEFFEIAKDPLLDPPSPSMEALINEIHLWASQKVFEGQLNDPDPDAWMARRTSRVSTRYVARDPSIDDPNAILRAARVVCGHQPGLLNIPRYHDAARPVADRFGVPVQVRIEPSDEAPCAPLSLLVFPSRWASPLNSAGRPYSERRNLPPHFWGEGPKV